VREQTIKALKAKLAEAGFANRQLKQIVAELSDHLSDLEDEGMRTGMSEEEASSFAVQQFGNPLQIAESFAQQEIGCAWPNRFPRLAACVLPIMYVVLLPAAPLLAGTESRARVCRWSAAMMLSGALTAAMFLGMQLAILLPQ